MVPASRKLGKSDAAEIAREATTVIAAKGKKVDRFEPGGRAGADVVAKMLGPTGNLRSPLIRTGRTVLVGFHTDVFEEVFGS